MMNLTNKADNDAERMGLYSAYILSSFPTKSHTKSTKIDSFILSHISEKVWSNPHILCSSQSENKFLQN